MADAVAPRDWRRRKHTSSTHTETRVESLPQEVQELLLEMADKIASLSLTIATMQQEAAELMAKIAKMEADQADMRLELDAFGQVTGNDLLKRSA